MHVLANIIHIDIHSSYQIPEDLAHLLKCLRLYNISFSPLVRKHASHEEEDVKSALFMRKKISEEVIVDDVISNKHPCLCLELVRIMLMPST